MKIRRLTNSEVVAYLCGLIVGAAGYASGQYYYTYTHSRDTTAAATDVAAAETEIAMLCLAAPVGTPRPPICTKILDGKAKE